MSTKLILYVEPFLVLQDFYSHMHRNFHKNGDTNSPPYSPVNLGLNKLIRELSAIEFFVVDLRC